LWGQRGPKEQRIISQERRPGACQREPCRKAVHVSGKIQVRNNGNRGLQERIGILTADLSEERLEARRPLVHHLLGPKIASCRHIWGIHFHDLVASIFERLSGSSD